MFEKQEVCVLELYSLFIYFIIIVIIIIYFIILYWFCHTSTCIRHGCTHVSHPEPPPTSLPIPSLWVIPVHQPQASCILHQTWIDDSFLIGYYTCFNGILPNYPPSLSHRIRKIVLYICVSFPVLHTGLLLPSTVLLVFFLAYFALYNKLQFHLPH